MGKLFVLPDEHTQFFVIDTDIVFYHIPGGFASLNIILDEVEHHVGVAIFGESHGPLIGVVLDGVPAGMPLSREDFLADLDRRRSGAKGSTPRKESDLPEIVSGVCDGHTTGAPLTIVFRNSNTRSGDYSDFRATPRPGHADFVAERKYRAFNDLRGGGHFSGRLTLTLVAAGVVAYSRNI